MKQLDGKFHLDGEQIIKTSNGEAIPDDEPVMILRGRDYLALPLLYHYLKLCEQDGCTQHQLCGVADRIAIFTKFAAEHSKRLKQPGITRGL